MADITGPNFGIFHPKQTAVILVNWDNTGAYHWVRFAGQTPAMIYLMNPGVPGKYDEHPVVNFNVWPQLRFLLEYTG